MSNSMITCVRFCFAAVLAALLATAPAAAESLAGKILDPDGKVVAKARVRLFDRHSGQLRATFSASDGAFSFPDIPAGDYLLESDAANSALKASVALSVEGDDTQDIILAVSGTSTEIQVTANNNPLTIQEVAKTIDVVDAQELNLRNEFSLSEAIRTLPGVRVQTLEGPGSSTTIQTRGLRSSDTAVLIDGMRFRDAASIANDATSLLEEIVFVDPDRIEFLRGSGSTLYGSNALAGVINVNSAVGGGRPHGSFRFEGGGLGLVRSVANFAGGLGTDRFTYSGGASHLYVTSGVREGLPYRNNSLQGSARLELMSGMSVSGRAWYSNNYSNSTESPVAITANSPNGTVVKAVPLSMDQLELYEKGQPYSAGNATFIPNTIDPDGRRRGIFLNGMLSFQHQIQPGTSYRLAYQSLDTRRAHLDGPSGTNIFDFFAPAQSNFNGFVDTFQARLDQNIGRHSLVTLGYELDSQQYLSFDGVEAGAGNTTNRADFRQHSHAFYVQDQIAGLGGRLQITASGRIQLFKVRSADFEGFANPYSSSLERIDIPTAYTGDGAISYFVRSSQTKLRAHIGNSFRDPSGFERFGGGFGDYYGDPRLAPERSVALDGGIDQWLLNSRAQLSATAFYTNLQQTIIFLDSFPAGADPYGRRFGGYANGGGGIARGFEVSGRLSPRSSLKLSASYTYTNSDQRMPSIPPDYYKVLDLSPHAFTVTATQWFGQAMNVSFDLTAYSDYTMTLSGGGTRQFRFNGPVKPDLVVRRTFTPGNGRSLEVYGKIENMFGQRAYEDGFIGPRAWFIAGFRIQ